MRDEAGRKLLHLSEPDFDDGNVRDAACLEGGKIDIEEIRVEAHRHIELEPSFHRGARCGWQGERNETARRIEGEILALFHRRAGDFHDYRSGDRLHDLPCVACLTREIGFHKLEHRALAIARANHLISCVERCRRWTAFPVRSITPAKAVESSAPCFEEGDER